jgi:hypothetical protein
MMPVLARTRTRALWRGAIAWHRGGCQLDGAPNGNGAGRGGAGENSGGRE